MAEDEHDEEEELHNSEEKLHNSGDTPDADDDHSEEQTDEPAYALNFGALAWRNYDNRDEY